MYSALLSVSVLRRLITCHIIIVIKLSQILPGKTIPIMYGEKIPSTNYWGMVMPQKYHAPNIFAKGKNRLI